MTAETGQPHWFSVRCIFRVQGDEYFEERITLWVAHTLDEALRLAETEAKEYGDIVNAVYVGLAQAFEMAVSPEHGAEVFSLVRRSSLSPDDYVETFFSNGDEIGG